MTKRSSQNGRGGGSGPQGGGGGGPSGRKIISGLSIQEKIVLQTTENAWKPDKLRGAGAKVENGAEEDPMAVLERKARAILNKLTPQKFDILIGRFNELDIDTDEKLDRCMHLVFEKAIDEPGFSVAYAKMCLDLQKREAATKGAKSQFRKLLITRCQTEFEKDYMDAADKLKYEEEMKTEKSKDVRKKLQAEFEGKERKARHRSLGNIKFIGELYKLKMLTSRIMHECVKKLLASTPLNGKTDEESIESLCNLLGTVGKDLEMDTMAKLNSGGAKDPNIHHFDHYFAQMQSILERKQTSSRVRFMLKDTIDLRRDNWKPRRDVAGPKTLDQIHQEVEKDRQQQELNHLLLKNVGGGGGQGKSSLSVTTTVSPIFFIAQHLIF
jgi:translation initiation factor 4G